MSAMAAPIRQRTPEWIAWRRRHITSADAAVLAGERGSMFQLWAEKRDLAEPVFDDDTEDLMQIGELLEPSLRSLYSSRTGRPIRQRHISIESPDWHVAGASLDAESGRRIVETKWSHSVEWFRAVAEGSPDPVPAKTMAQVQWQMYVARRDVADVAILLGREFKVIEVGRDDGYIGNLLYIARWLWPYVESGERPPVDGSDATTQTIRRLHPADNGGWLPATPELADLVDQLREAKVLSKEAEAHEGTVANALRAILGDWSGITGLISNKKNADSQATDWKSYAAGLEAFLDDALDDHGELWPEVRARLREQAPALRSLHTTTKEGPRVLRLLGGKS